MRRRIALTAKGVKHVFMEVLMSNYIWYEHSHIATASQLPTHRNYTEAVRLQEAAVSVGFYMGNSQMESAIRQKATEAMISVNNDINSKAVWLVEDGFWPEFSDIFNTYVRVEIHHFYTLDAEYDYSIITIPRIYDEVMIPCKFQWTSLGQFKVTSEDGKHSLYFRLQ